MSDGRPPRLIVKTLAVTFATATALLVIVFLFVRTSVNDQVRRSVAGNLDASQRMLAAIEERRVHELRGEAGSLAENPTLKAAVDTYFAELSTADGESRSQLLATIQRELDKLAVRVEPDAIALSGADGVTLAVAGRLGDSWRDRRTAPTAEADDGADTLVVAGGRAFRTITVPLTLDDGATIGRLELGGALDEAHTRALDGMSGARSAIMRGDQVLASTLPPAAARALPTALAAHAQPSGSLVLDGASYAYREIARTGDVRIYALGSIEDAAREALGRLNTVLVGAAAGALALALVGSLWLARLLTYPIERLSAALAHMSGARDFTRPVSPDSSSRELNLLTTTFNGLMASVVDAEARTEAAYASAIHALAATLDARDPYTAGHSERVSVLSVAIGRVLHLPDEQIEVLRLGALLHDIGKIGIPDDVLRKPGPLTDAEFAAIQTHPVVGARILRTIPFLLPHVDIVELHHERPDGLGYPRGLRGDDIPLLARIVHVADAYDAITSARAYRQGRSSREAMRELWRCTGTEYHADIVAALAQALPAVTPIGDAATLEAMSA